MSHCKREEPTAERVNRVRKNETRRENESHARERVAGEKMRSMKEEK